MEKNSYEVRQIDAWYNDEEGWWYNDSYFIGTMQTAAGNIGKAFRRYLNNCGIAFKQHQTETTYDGSVYEIIDRKTKEPLFAAIPQF